MLFVMSMISWSLSSLWYHRKCDYVNAIEYCAILNCLIKCELVLHILFLNDWSLSYNSISSDPQMTLLTSDISIYRRSLYRQSWNRSLVSECCESVHPFHYLDSVTNNIVRGVVVSPFRICTSCYQCERVNFLDRPTKCNISQDLFK